MSQNLSSAAVVIGALRVKKWLEGKNIHYVLGLLGLLHIHGFYLTTNSHKLAYFWLHLSFGKALSATYRSFTVCSITVRMTAV